LPGILLLMFDSDHSCGHGPVFPVSIRNKSGLVQEFK